jgi:hypothetical protein
MVTQNANLTHFFFDPSATQKKNIYKNWQLWLPELFLNALIFFFSLRKQPFFD